MFKKLIFMLSITTMMALSINQVHGEEEAAADSCSANSCDAYCDSGRATYLTAALPIAAIAIAGIIIATTNHHNHHTSSSNSSILSHLSGEHHHHKSHSHHSHSYSHSH